MLSSNARQSRRKTPWDTQADRTATQEFLFQHYKSHYQERHPVLNMTLEEALINSFTPSSCPCCQDHIAEGSTLIHDKDVAHSMLVKKLNHVSEVYDSKELKKLIDKENPLRRVNGFHALLKNFLNAHSSFDRESLQGYLNLFSLSMNPPSDNLEKAEKLLELAFKTQKTLRYRDFFNAN